MSGNHDRIYLFIRDYIDDELFPIECTAVLNFSLHLFNHYDISFFMAKRLFSCPLSEQDELDYYAALMEQHNIEYYITPGSAFGFSKPGFWIKDDEAFPVARQLFEEHQLIYAEQARKKYQQETGYNPDATGKEKWDFFLKNLYQKRFLLPWIFLGFVILYWYFDAFLGIFSSTPSQN